LSEKVEVKLSKKLIEGVQRQVDESEGEFRTIDEFIEFVLTEILKDEESEQVYTPEEEEEIKKRLRALGYIE